MNRPLFLAIVVVDLLGLLAGFGITVITDAMPFLTTEFQLNGGNAGLGCKFNGYRISCRCFIYRETQ